MANSPKTHFVLFRSSLASLASALIDYTVFVLVFYASTSIAASQACARLASVFFNYTAMKRLVFISDRRHAIAFPKYVSLAIFSGFVSYLAIKAIVSFFPIHVFLTKGLVETTMFLANFAIQRNFIFVNEKKAQGDIN